MSKIDPTSRQAILPIGRGYEGVAADAVNVWVVNRYDGTVTRIDPQAGKEHVAATVTSTGAVIELQPAQEGSSRKGADVSGDELDWRELLWLMPVILGAETSLH